jgi:myo-inositol-1(or 4)-monophosphatase
MRAETEAAIAAAQIAQKIADSREGADIITSKGGIDLVTTTDVACEDAIRAELLRRFPGYPVIGEERGGSPVEGKPYWLVDPICGTRTFASNIPLYCTNIALVENGTVTVGAIGIGRTSEIIYAEKGSGAHMRSPGGQAVLQASAGSNTIWIDGKNQLAAAIVRDAILRGRWYVCMFPSSVAAPFTAMGRMAAVLHSGLNVPSSGTGSVHWAAGCFVASQAGAIVTDLETHGEWTLKTRSFLIAANRALHDELSALVEWCKLESSAEGLI